MSSLPHMTARFDLQTVTNEARRLYKAGPWLGHGATLLAETEAHEEKIPGPDEFHDVRLRESAGKLFWEPDTVELGPWQPLTLAARIYPDPDAFQVQMRGAFGRKGLATVPLNRDGPVFRGNLAVAHVPLYYQFLVDGRPYPDPGPASHQVCCGAEGLTTPWTESGEKRYIRIHNESERLLRGTLTCPNNTVTVTPERLTLKPGEEALLSLAGGSGISPRRLKSTLVLALDDANVSPDSLDVTWQPDWPDPLVMPRDAAVSLPTQQIFGTICEVPLRLHVTGSGPVRIYVFCRENGWLHEATTNLESAEAWQELTIRLPLPLHRLGNSPPGRLTLLIDTGNSSDNLRFFEMEVRMPLLRLIKDPKFLNFLKLKPGTDQTGVFRVERSDGQPVALEVIIPPSSRLAGNLEISPVLPNLWSVTAKSADLAPGTLLAEAIILRDSLSGMEDVLPVLLSTR